MTFIKWLIIVILVVVLIKHLDAVVNFITACAYMITKGLNHLTSLMR